MASIYVGTSGWVYPHWSGVFYPEDLPQREWLDHYSRHFDTVEINNSFYRLPSRSTFEGWRRRAPPGFTFAVKANRYITHVKKLKDPEEAVRNFYDNLAGMGDACGVVLFQLPPRWRANLERLEGFLKSVPDTYRLAFEFRDSTWLNDEVYELLRKRGSALCTADRPIYPGPRVVTADFAFFRMHGGRELADGEYSYNELKALAREVGAHARAGRDVFVYFNNDYRGFAPENALALKDLLKGKGAGRDAGAARRRG